MDRVTFMRELEQLFSELSPRERRTALSIFENEFDMAGPEGEADVIRRLGSPRQAAGQIIYIEDSEDYEADGAHTKAADQAQYRMPVERQMPQPDRISPLPLTGIAADQAQYRMPMERQMPQPDRISPLPLAGIAVVLCLLVIAGISVGVRTLSFGILTLLVALTLGPCIGAVVLAIVGYSLVINGVVLLASYTASAFLTIGCGFLCMAAGMLLFILFIIEVFRLLPILWQNARKYFRNLIETVRQFRERGRRT